MSIFTLRMWYPVFGLRIGSRGTPWNSKSAGPGGSDFAKCQKVPFIWHFGLFRVFTIFDIFHVFIFSLLCFFTFSLFPFWWFLCFSDFLIFVTFCIFDDFDDFHFFHCFYWFFNFFKGILKIRPSFDHFCPPSSTPMASTWRGSIPYVKFDHLFFVTFPVFHSFYVIFDRFWVIFQFCH